MKVEVLGKGCPKCKKTEEIIGETLKKIGVEAEVVHVTDLEEIVDRGVLMTPAVIVDGEKKIEGRIPTEAEIRRWFGK
ncbi:MAG TPA: thioredoxin family protein [Clostridia bacterium]|nr:thioredoxin family protein [Clostridia bacterium]